MISSWWKAHNILNLTQFLSKIKVADFTFVIYQARMDTHIMSGMLDKAKQKKNEQNDKEFFWLGEVSYMS